MVVVGTESTPRTFVQAVNRCLYAIGESAVGTLVSPTRRVSMAMQYVEAARDEVYYRTLWEFRRGHFRVTLVASTMWYAIPSDYHKMATGPSMNRKDGPLQYVNYETLISMYPDLRAFAPGTGVGSLASVIQLNAQATTFGTPEDYCIVNEYIGLYPIPDATFVTAETYLYCTYWKQAPSLTSDYDDLGLTRDLYLACDYLAIAGLKKALEYPDWQGDQQLGDIQLRRASNDDREPDDSNINNTNSINYNE